MSYRLRTMERRCASKMSGAWWNYCNSCEATIWEAYKRPSGWKVDAYHECLNLMRELDGWDGRVTGHNAHFFGFGFKFAKDGVTMFCYCNAWGTYYIEKQKLD